MILVDNQLTEVLPEIISPYEPSLVGPNSYDLRLSNEFRVFTYRDIMPVVNYTYDPRQPDDRFIWQSVTTKKMILKPGQFILASTVETFDLSIAPGLCADVVGKSSIARTGLGVELAGFVDSGFKGQITLEIVNHLPCNYVLYADQLIAQARFYLTEKPVRSYAEGDHSYQNQKGPTAAKMSKIYRFVDDTPAVLAPSVPQVGEGV